MISANNNKNDSKEKKHSSEQIIKLSYKECRDNRYKIQWQCVWKTSTEVEHHII